MRIDLDTSATKWIKVYNVEDVATPSIASVSLSFDSSKLACAMHGYNGADKTAIFVVRTSDGSSIGPAAIFNQGAGNSHQILGQGLFYDPYDRIHVTWL